MGKLVVFPRFKRNYIFRIIKNITKVLMEPLNDRVEIENSLELHIS
jgi:hypothetical protein